MPPSGSPVDERSTPAYKAARMTVIILSALIILALIGLAVGMVLKMGGKSAATPERRAAAAQDGGKVPTYLLPHDGEVLSTQTQPGRLIVHVRTPAGDEIHLFDTETGKPVAVLRKLN